MKQIHFGTLVLATLFLSAFTTLNTIEWKISDDYSINFKADHAEGIFKTMDGKISFNPDDLNASYFSASIDVSSINTGNGMKNKHAKSDKWMDAERYATIDFNSSSFSKTDSGYEVKGTLEMHGVKKEITIPFTFESNTFKGSFSVNRMDYSIGKMKGMSKKVSNQINLDISVPVTKN